MSVCFMHAIAPPYYSVAGIVVTAIAFMYICKAGFKLVHDAFCSMTYNEYVSFWAYFGTSRPVQTIFNQYCQNDLLQHRTSPY